MRRAVDVQTAGTWPEGEAVVTATLPFDAREKRRFKLQDDKGEAFLLDLVKPTVLREGDGLSLEGGGFIHVSEAPEPVVDAWGSDARQTARLAWHLGNRHLPVQILPDGGIRFRADSVIEAMLVGLGAETKAHDAPFSPEPGAYAGHGHGHSHGHSHD